MAISTAAKMMSDHLELFRGTAEDVEIVVEKEEDSKGKISDILIENLDLSVRSYNSLKRMGINLVEDLTRKTEKEMLKMRNLGIKSFEEVKFKLEELGLSFHEDE
ncbi:DNA-directed RNA polymerase subunit alpha (fragment) [Candidatus Desulfosporosinus infrequens]|uniref:DNA-directed RNA polymerase subunit alpha n=1 Tax=Candidatus Desulfosporosinus infrequens TaxID=2043169 RepID=A0A2U3K2D8_9FIRM